MNFKMFLLIIVAVLVGYFFGDFIFKGYKKDILETFGEKENVFFLQQGVYSSVQSLEENTRSLTNYIYEKEDDLYKVYVALTKDYENAFKLKGLYEDLGNSIYIKEQPLKDRKFLEILNQYDNLIKLIDDNNNLEIIAKEVLIKYKELVLANEKSLN